MRRARYSAIFLCFFFAGCSGGRNTSLLPSISEEVKKDLAAPVDCATAEQNIAFLDQAKPSIPARIRAGFRSFAPVAAVEGLITNDYFDRMNVLFGRHNQDIEKKIQDIRTQCES